ncbi:MAG: SIMPL domain-containing protein, partial [Moraxellaceae bacterium]|nr:SIMPL domain-containing protein [Moraxellaceae bacterium]
MNFFKKSVQVATITTLLTTSTLIYAETTGYDQISFTSEAKTEIANDELYASMYKKTQAKTAKALAIKLNASMNKAMKIAKHHPNVEVMTGLQSTYPKYDKKDNIIAWTGQANIDIKSTHLDDASQLIADLQNELVLDNLRFGVSEKRKDKIKADLMLKVAERFQNRAETIAKSWGANGYRIVKVDLRT